MMRSANSSYYRLWAIRFEIQILQDGTHNTPYSPSSILDFFMHALKEDLCIDTWYFLFFGGLDSHIYQNLIVPC